MKLLRSNTTGYWRTALAVAAFLTASQTAGASTVSVLFTLSPIDILMAPGASGTFEVDLKNTGSDSLTIGAFRFGLTTSASGITFDSVTTGTTHQYIFAYPGVGSQNGLTLASVLNPSVAVMDMTGSQSRVLVPGDIVGLGEITYHVNSNAAPGSVINISFAPPAVAGWSCTGPPPGLCEYLNTAPILDWQTFSDTFDPADLVGGELTVGNQVDPPVDAPEPSSLLPVGLILIGLGAVGKRQIRAKKRRRSVPGVRRSEPPRPNLTEPCEHSNAV